MENIDIDIEMDFLGNINIHIDKGILQNINIDKILYGLEFGLSNRATPGLTWLHRLTSLTTFAKDSFLAKKNCWL